MTQPRRNSSLVYGLLAGVWLLVVAWQVEEHIRVRESAENALRRSSQATANSIGAVVRAQQFFGTVISQRLQPVLNELTNSPSPDKVVSIEMLNATNGVVASAGRLVDLQQPDLLQTREHWGLRSMTHVYPVEGPFLNPEGTTNSQGLVIVELPTNFMRGPRGFPRRDRRSGEREATNGATGIRAAGPPPGRDFGPPRGDEFRRRPFWARDFTEAHYQEMLTTHELHGLVITLSTESLQAAVRHDFWMRVIIAFFAGVSAAGAGLALRNVSQTADLQIRLVRASELNSHLKEMNLAAAGLAHETRNPLNMIRGVAQMLSKQPDAPPEIREKTRVIMDETDKVTAQIIEFINYSRPREVRRAKVALNAAFAEVLRTLTHDIGEKKLRVGTAGEPVTIEADDQLFRQVLFNLLINAIQAVGEGGQIQIAAQRVSATEAALEVRDDGPGVSPEQRQEIFKPYFTTHQKGTGLGLAIVQQIVHAHGWEIECFANEPKGAIFRITHLKLVA
jgi:signal transduction histidine kinase